jgi:hypothetical protein
VQHIPNPPLDAAILLLCRELLPDCAVLPSTAEALALTGADETEANDALGRLRDLLPAMLEAAAAAQRDKVFDAAYGFIVEHPECVYAVGKERRYTEEFGRFVVGLRAPGQPGEGMSDAELASVLKVPLPTLEGWLISQ